MNPEFPFIMEGDRRYLGCNIRTSPLEEVLGLPSIDLRLARSRVFAYRHELDAWFGNARVHEQAPEQPKAGIHILESGWGC